MNYVIAYLRSWTWQPEKGQTQAMFAYELVSRFTNLTRDDVIWPFAFRSRSEIVNSVNGQLTNDCTFWYKLTVEISYQAFKIKKYFLGVLVAQSSVMSRKFREIYMLEFLFIRTKTPFPPFLGESFLSLNIRNQ